MGAYVKLKFSDVRDTILIEEICRRDSRESSILSSTFNAENKERGFENIFNKDNGGMWRNGKSKSGKNVEC